MKTFNLPLTLCGYKYILCIQFSSISIEFSALTAFVIIILKCLILPLVVDCGPLTASDGFNLSVSSTHVNSTAVYTGSCDDGEILVGDTVRTCQADGTWSGQEPYCQSKLYNQRWPQRWPHQDQFIP